MDKITPVYIFDDTALFKTMALNPVFVFHDVLSPQKLRDSLQSLVRMDGWRKLGARLRRNKQGRLEYHIPNDFSENRPAITFRHTEHNMVVSSHPIGSQLPSPTATPAVVIDPEIFQDLVYHRQIPWKIQDYINVDIPQLGIHIVSFKDATLISLVVPHLCCDMIGVGALLKAWVAVLEQKTDNLPQLHGIESDPLAEFGLYPTEPHKLQSKQASLPRLATQYVLPNLSGLLFGTKKRLVCIPGEFIARLREDALKELAKNSSGDPKPFVSEGDVLCAWWSRMLTAHLQPDSDKIVAIYNTQSLRSLLSPDIIPPGYEYLSNAVGFIPALVPMNVLSREHLSISASHIRQSITELGTRAQAEAYAALFRKSRFKMHPWFGENVIYGIMYSNLTYVKLFEVDFAAAIVKTTTSKPKPGIKPGMPYSVMAWEGFTYPNFFPILGKDGEGNYWLTGNLRNAAWERLSKVLENEFKGSC